jgi:lipopolysaccharide export system permease protein
VAGACADAGGAGAVVLAAHEPRLDFQVAAMIILRRYLAREVYVSTAFVFVGFLALFAFFDLINELGDLGKGNYRLPNILLFVLLTVPSHVYELAPIAVLIGTLYSLSYLASNSEFTVMRVSGLSPLKAAAVLGRIGIVFVIIIYAFGELVAPYSEKAAQQVRLTALSSSMAQALRTGLWVKEELRFVNVREVLPDSTIKSIKVYDFDNDFRLLTISEASRGDYQSDNVWRLTGVVRTHFEVGKVWLEKLPDMMWKSVLTPEMLSVLIVQPERMSAWNLYQYTRHLSSNNQKTERFEIALWKKLVYPFAALVMMALALPFAYVHVRAGGVGVKIFSGIMLGILFHMLNSLFSHLGLLQNWSPLTSAILPSLVFLTAALMMMWWVERR